MTQRSKEIIIRVIIMKILIIIMKIIKRRDTLLTDAQTRAQCRCMSHIMSILCPETCGLSPIYFRFSLFNPVIGVL